MLGDKILNLKKSKKAAWTNLGKGFNLDAQHQMIDVGIPDANRARHFLCMGTTGVGKSRLIEHMVAQDIRKGYSVVVIDPKGDNDLMSKIVQIAFETDRQDELMLVTPIYPSYSAVLDPLSDYYLPEELVGHITAGVPVGREPFFANVAYEVSLLVVQALILLAKYEGRKASFNLEDIKNNVQREKLEELKGKVDQIHNDEEAVQLSIDLQAVLNNPADYYSKVASSLRVSLTELTSGHIGKIIGKADSNKFIRRLETGKSVILIVQLGAMMTQRASYTAGKVVISMIKSFAGRVYASDRRIKPPLSLHMDECQSLLFNGIEDLFAKGGSAGIYIHAYCQSVSQLYQEVGQDRANSILDNCNSKVFMRSPDEKTARYISGHLGLEKRYSPMFGLGGTLNIREIEEERVKPTDVLKMASQEFYLMTYSGIFKGKTAHVESPTIKVQFPDVDDYKKEI